MNISGRRPAFFLAVFLAVTVAMEATAGAADCPSDRVEDLLNDPAVQDALKDSWEDSKEGTPGEHEEGGFVLECASIDANGNVVYHIRVVRVEPGDEKELGSKIPSLPPGCRVIAFLHTHPGPERGHPEQDDFFNDRPSRKDLWWTEQTGFPGILVYGTGPEYDDDTTTITFGRESPLDNCREIEKKAGEAKGDPHLQTFDGLAYDFQAVGEYVLATDRDIEVQVRFEPIAASDVVSITTAVAARLGPSVAEVRLDGELRLDGVIVEQFPPEVGGVAIESSGDGARASALRFVWSDGTSLTVLNGGVLLSVRLETLRFGWEGLLGDGDGDRTNDLVGVNGPLEGRTDFAALYDELRPKWAVTAASSMFTYAPDESPDSFFNDAFPSAIVGFADFDVADVDNARGRCIDAVIWFAPYLDDCTYDLLVTGAAEVIDASAAAYRQQFPTIDLGSIEGRVQLTGSVDVENGGAIYLIEGTPGSLLSIHVETIRDTDHCPGAIADFRLLILDRHGEQIGSAWPGNNGCLAYGPWEFPADGRLGVVIRSDERIDDEDLPKTGSFSISIGTPNGRTETVELGIDEHVTVQGRLDIALDFVDYRLIGAPGDLVSIEVQALDGVEQCGGKVWDLRLAAIAPDGSELGQEWPGNEGCRPYGGWVLPDAGEITLRLHGGDGGLAATTGDYVVTIGRFRYAAVEVEIQTPSVSLSGAVDIALDGTVYEIHAPAGAEMYVDVLSLDGEADCGREAWNFYLSVSDADGDPIGVGWPGNSGCDTFGPWIVPDSGMIHVLAHGHDFGAAPFTGSYEIAVTVE